MGDIEVTIETLRRVVDRHDKARDDLIAVSGLSQALAGIEPPMTDPATTAYVTAVRDVGRAHLDALAAVERDLGTRVEELTASVDQYATTEHENQRRLTGRG
ncbi:hypothetical protein ACIGNX_02575 [Actinosynnema sp. NPDC053489]|uniref:hypothetical protein n=1 Tax=Actinosynnema sp. NPDC053489 TaxID=3363916 RepID=UPI0037C8441E